MRIRVAFLLPFLCLLAFSAVQGQNLFYGALGLNQSYVSADSLNWVFRHYNETQGNLNTELGEINYVPGLAFSGGAGFGNFLLDVSFVSRFAALKSARGTDPDNEYLQQMRYAMNTINVGAGYNKVIKEVNALGFGLSLDFGRTRIRNRQGLETNIRNQPFYQAYNETVIASSVFFQYLIGFGSDMGPSLLIRPYFQYHWWQGDAFPLNRTLNFQTYLNDPSFILYRPNNVGLLLMFSFHSIQ